MIGDNLLYAQPDDSVPSWLLLRLQTKSGCPGPLTGWELGIANVREIIEVKEERGENLEDERELLQNLMGELENHRDSRATLVTCSRETIPLLRSRLLAINVRNVTLRGLTHISLENVVDQHFVRLGSKCSENENRRLSISENLGTVSDRCQNRYEDSIIGLWLAMTHIGPLVSPQDLKGKHL